MQHRANLGKTLADFVFVAAIVGMVVLGATQLFGHIFLWRHGTGPIVRILVALVVASLFHKLGGGVPQIQRNSADLAGIHVRERLVNGVIAGV